MQVAVLLFVMMNALYLFLMMAMTLPLTIMDPN